MACLWVSGVTAAHHRVHSANILSGLNDFVMITAIVRHVSNRVDGGECS